MKIRARAPLRLGFAGGGTDLLAYSSVHGGAVLNATISLHAYAEIATTSKNLIFNAWDLDQSVVIKSFTAYPEGPLALHQAVHKRLVLEFGINATTPISVSTYSSAPPGSGLGSSSAVVVAMLKAYQHYFNLALDQSALAQLAFDIERNDCQFPGGQQDQYAATFGGINFCEFPPNSRATIQPVDLTKSILDELESNIILFFTGVSRDSEAIILDQSTYRSDPSKLTGLHGTKVLAYQMKDALIDNNLESFISLNNHAWRAKQETSVLISNEEIRTISDTVIAAGAGGLKVSGAGGGGFMIIYCPPSDRFRVLRSLDTFDGTVYPFVFTPYGCSSWVVAE